MSIISGIAGLTSSEVLALINRGGEEGTAGLYACKTILNEHRPVCTKEYHLVGKYLDGADNPDVWFPIPGGGGGTVVYDNRFLTLTSGTLAGSSATRCVIDQTKFPINGNFLEVTCKIGSVVNGAGGQRIACFGFAPAFNSLPISNRALFLRSGNVWYCAYASQAVAVSSLPLGRNLQSGDICTVRLDRQEGSSNIDIVRFYVNGQKQYETTNIPAENCYTGIGVFTDADTTTAMSIAIDYFGVKFVP